MKVVKYKKWKINKSNQFPAVFFSISTVNVYYDIHIVNGEYRKNINKNQLVSTSFEWLPF